MSFVDYLQSDSFKAASRNIVSAGLGVIGTLGVLTVAQQHDLIQAWGDIQSGLAQFLKGAMVFAGILGPIVMARMAWFKATPSQQVKSGAIAAPQVSPAERLVAIDAVAKLPEVKEVKATLATAQATDSNKVTAA